MDAKMDQKIKAFMDEVKARNGHEPEFIQAVQEVAETVIPYIAQHEIYSGEKGGPILTPKENRMTR